MDTSFVVMSDTHFTAGGTTEDGYWWNRMITSQSPDIADSIVSTVRTLAPDCVIHCGDFTNVSDLESFRFGKDVMDQLGCPYYIVLGNHDTYVEGNRRAIAPLFDRSADGKFYYTRQLAGLRFVFLDCAYWIRKDGTEGEHLDFDLHKKNLYAGIGPSREELAWLERELMTHQEIPTVIVCHPPLHAKPTYAIGSLPGGKPVEGDAAHWDLAPERRFTNGNACITKKYCVHDRPLRTLIAGSPNVVAVFAGHWHILDITRDQGVLHCQTGALVEYPFDIRLVRIRGQRLSITTVGLDSPKFKQDSLVPEWNNQWVAGSDGDRECSMTIAKGDLEVSPGP